MRKTVIGLASMIAPAVLGAVTAAGCDKVAEATDDITGGFEEICGPCGLVAEGDVGISGNAKVDGFFAAVATLNRSFININASFAGRIDNLIAAWDVDVAPDATLEAKIAALKAEINAEISANTMGGLTVNYVPPQCQANVSVAVEAQAKCEAKAGCTAMVDPGEVSVECSGECTGECSAMCTGGYKCDFKAGGTCDGECSGSCEIEGMAACNGTCRGECDGTCEVRDSMGNCAGKCEGDCSGTCEISGSASCTGTCTGSCKVDAEAKCEGEPVQCSGSCSGECKGSCKGTARPPEASANCDASLDCKGQASAQASAELTCTPPALDIGFTFSASVDASAQAAFSAKMAALRVEGVAIVQGFGNLSALFTGEIDGEVVFNPSPLAQITTSVNGLISGSGSVFAGIPVGRIGCATEAFSASATTLAQMPAAANAAISAQAGFVTSLTTGNY